MYQPKVDFKLLRSFKGLPFILKTHEKGLRKHFLSLGSLETAASWYGRVRLTEAVHGSSAKESLTLVTEESELMKFSSGEQGGWHQRL